MRLRYFNIRKEREKEIRKEREKEMRKEREKEMRKNRDVIKYYSNNNID